MPLFGPGEQKIAEVPMLNPTAKPFDYVAELYMGENLALMSSASFHLDAFESKDVSLPVIMPTGVGTYPVHIGVFSNSQNIALYRAVEDVVIAPIADAWIYPSGYSDPDGKWINEPNAYDGNLSTYAFNSLTKYGHYVEYSPAVPLNCSRVRIYALAYIPYGPVVNPNLAIDVYYENSWHNIFSGGINRLTWVEKSIPAGTKVVSKARIKSNRSDAHLEIREFQFWGH